MAPAPVHVSSLPVYRLSGSHKTYPPSKYAAVKRIPCSILKKSPQIRGIPKKKVRFSLPDERKAAADDSSSHFKGFTSAETDKLRISIENIKGLQESLTLKQKIAVEEAIRRKNGSIPIKLGRRKGYLCQKKLERQILNDGPMVKTENVDEVDAFPQMYLKELESRKMQCRICDRIAYLPVTQQQTEVGTSKYFCNDCFQSSAMFAILPSGSQLNAPKIGVGVALRNVPTVLTTANLGSNLLEKRQIIISSNCSFAGTMVSDGSAKPMDELFDDTGKHFFSPVKMEEPKYEIATNSELNFHQVKNHFIPKKKLEGRTKTVTLWTAEGQFTVRIPCEEEHYASLTNASSNVERVEGTHEDPICIDNND